MGCAVKWVTIVGSWGPIPLEHSEKHMSHFYHWRMGKLGPVSIVPIPLLFEDRAQEVHC